MENAVVNGPVSVEIKVFLIELSSRLHLEIGLVSNDVINMLKLGDSSDFVERLHEVMCPVAR